MSSVRWQWQPTGETKLAAGSSQNTDNCDYTEIFSRLNTLTLTGLRIFLHWFISMLKYQGRLINLLIRIIPPSVLNKNLYKSDIYFCRDVITD